MTVTTLSLLYGTTSLVPTTKANVKRVHIRARQSRLANSFHLKRRSMTYALQINFICTGHELGA